MTFQNTQHTNHRNSLPLQKSLQVELAAEHFLGQPQEAIFTPASTLLVAEKNNYSFQPAIWLYLLPYADVSMNCLIKETVAHVSAFVNRKFLFTIFVVATVSDFSLKITRAPFE